MTAALDAVSPVYPAGQIKRHRATNAEMEERAEFLIGYASEHGPVTVRGLYYQAVVHRLPGITKDDAGYGKVQHQVLMLRRAGRLDYRHVADSTRWMRKPRSWDSIEDALAETASSYRKNLWRNADTYVEIWCEKSTLAGVITPITFLYDVPLMPTGGYSSETFAFEAVASREDDRPYHVYYLGDFDCAGRDAARALEEKLTRFADERGIRVIFEIIGVNHDHVVNMRLPTRSAKRNTPADKKWPHPFACELDAMPPDHLRRLVEEAINRHLPFDQMHVLKVAEESERLEEYRERAGRRTFGQESPGARVRPGLTGPDMGRCTQGRLRRGTGIE